jgi:hypothetical protein
VTAGVFPPPFLGAQVVVAQLAAMRWIQLPKWARSSKRSRAIASRILDHVLGVVLVFVIR